LTGFFDSSRDIENLLEKVVATVSVHMKADVCSIYLYDEKKELLTLKASAGLPKEAIGRIKLKLGEGLVGKSLKRALGDMRQRRVFASKLQACPRDT